MSDANRKGKPMKREYVVIDEEGQVSWNAKTDRPECFKNFKSARARAEELAKRAPGASIKIFEFMASSVVPIGPTRTVIATSLGQKL